MEREKQPDPSPTTENRRASSRKTVRRLILSAALIVVIIALHRPVLRGVAGFLIVDQPLEKADVVVLLPSTLSSQDARDAAVQLFRDGTVRQILLLAPTPSRAVRYGAWPAPATLIRAALAAKGIPATAMAELPDCASDTDTAERLGRWMADKKAQRLILVCPRFLGRYERQVMQKAIGEQPALEIIYHAMPSQFNRDNWWRSRIGVIEILHQYTKLAFTRIYGEATPCAGDWSYEDLKNGLPAPEAVR
jgi:hypothetical protein